MVGSTEISPVVLGGVAVEHLESLWCPQTVDAHGEATPQSYQPSQVGHLFIQNRHALPHRHHLLGHSIKHIQGRLVFFLRGEERGHSLSEAPGTLESEHLRLSCRVQMGEIKLVFFRDFVSLALLKTQHVPSLSEGMKSAGF